MCVRQSSISIFYHQRFEVVDIQLFDMHDQNVTDKELKGAKVCVCVNWFGVIQSNRKVDCSIDYVVYQVAHF